jgi:isocitrate/isopropylmalate dehydrogenase
MSKYKIVWLPGDGVGNDVGGSNPTLEVAEAVAARV